MKKNNSLFVVLVSLFFLWALAHNLNPILIAKLRESFQLNDSKAMLVDSAFYVAYFIMAIPSAFMIAKLGYKMTIVFGLGFFGLGTLGFVPASSLHSFEFFLLALLFIGTGITMLEAAANPLITLISEPDQSIYRLNLAQSFNGLGAVMAAGLGGFMLLSENEVKHEINTTPFVVLTIIVVCLMVIITTFKFPIIQYGNNRSKGFSFVVFKNNLFVMSLLAQFLYVGAQIGVSSFFIRYMSQYFSKSLQDGAYLLSISLALFTLGRFVGSLLMRRYSASLILSGFCVGAILCSTGILLVHSISFYLVILLPFFMSIMFPTIFALGIGTLDQSKEEGSALIVMTISGGALIPYLMARLTGFTGEVSWAYVLPLLCFGFVLFFALCFKKK